MGTLLVALMVQVKENVPNTEFALVSRIGQYLLKNFERFEFDDNDTTIQQLMSALLIKKWPAYKDALKLHNVPLAHYTIKWNINAWSIFHHPISTQNKIIRVLSFSQDNKNDARTRGHLLATHLNSHTPTTARFAREHLDYAKDLQIQCFDNISNTIKDKISAVISTYDSVRLEQIYINSIRLVSTSLYELADSIFGANDQHVLLNKPVAIRLTNLTMKLENSLCTRFNIKILAYASGECTVYFKNDDIARDTVISMSSAHLVTTENNMHYFNLNENTFNFDVKLECLDNFCCVFSFCFN